MPESLHVLLVRHGESVGNAGQATEDAASAPLTPLGERQAQAVAASLSATPAFFVMSPYTRSQLTAAPARARFPDVPVEIWPVHEFTYLGPHVYAGTTVGERRPAVDAYWDAGDPHRVDGEGAESFAMFIARVQQARERLERSSASPVVVFSHKKFINALLWSWLAGPPVVSAKRMARYRGFDHAMAFPNGGCVSVWLGSDGPRLGPVRRDHLEGVVA